MDVFGRDGAKPWMPLFFSFVLILGMVLGFNLRDTLRSKRDISDVVDRNDRLEQVIDLINEKYVDSVNSDNLYKDAISGILKSLDPHTVYIPAENLQEANEDLEGEFSGVGIEYSILKDTVSITSVLDKGPAAKAGLEPGDQLIKVGDSLIAGNGINAPRIARLLKGRQKSKVLVSIRRYHENGLKQYAILRDVIPIPSVEAGIMIDDKTAYIKVNRFSATVYIEFRETLDKLVKDGAQQLVLDLRDNPGGYLDQVTAIADELLDDTKLIVYTEGSHASRTTYKAGKKGLFEQGKLAVLINESSASAAEILAGAIQDWDRGIIIGKRSFGKGLVQEPYEMTDGSEIRLTIAKYYTPSGRCIQRSFSKGRDAYEAEYENRLKVEPLSNMDFYNQIDTTRYFTAGKRVVYGGGGIAPDVFAVDDTERLSPRVEDKLYSNELKAAIWSYYLQHRQQLAYKKVVDFISGFHDENEILYQYLMTLDAADRKDLMLTLSRSNTLYHFNAYIKSQIGRFLFRNNGYFAIVLQDDLVVKKARELLDGKGYSDAISRK